MAGFLIKADPEVGQTLGSAFVCGVITLCAGVCNMCLMCVTCYLPADYRYLPA